MGYIQITERRNIGSRLLTQNRPLDVRAEFFAGDGLATLSGDTLDGRAELGRHTVPTVQPVPYRLLPRVQQPG